MYEIGCFTLTELAEIAKVSNPNVKKVVSQSILARGPLRYDYHNMHSHENIHMLSQILTDLANAYMSLGDVKRK